MMETKTRLTGDSRALYLVVNHHRYRMYGDKGVNQANHVLGDESNRLDSKSREYSMHDKALLLRDNRIE